MGRKKMRNKWLGVTLGNNEMNGKHVSTHGTSEASDFFLCLVRLCTVVSLSQNKS